MSIFSRNVLFSLMLFALVGCSTMNLPGTSACSGITPCGWVSPQGKVVVDGRDTKNSEFNHLDEDMNYYYSDSDSLPVAVVKLSKKYTLDVNFWKQITDPEMLEAVIKNLKEADATEGAHKVRSYTVKAYDARPIGAWYSSRYVYGMRLNMFADNRVSLSAPNFRNTINFFAKRNDDNLHSKSMPSSSAINSSYQVSTELSQATLFP